MSAITLCGYTAISPSSTPTLAAGTAVGLLDTSAVYQYKVSYTTRFGETDVSSAVSITTGSTTPSVNLTAIPVSADGNIIGRKLYRTAGAGSSFLLLATIEDNITTTYTDIIADGSLGAAAPTANSAHSLQTVDGLVKFGNLVCHSVQSGIIAFAGGGQTSATALTAEYCVVATVATTADSVLLPVITSQMTGAHIRVRNAGANSLAVFPNVGQTINSGSANVAISVAAAATVDLVVTSSTNWIQV